MSSVEASSPSPQRRSSIRQPSESSSPTRLNNNRKPGTMRSTGPSSPLGALGKKIGAM